jgi:hypothetical protein
MAASGGQNLAEVAPQPVGILRREVESEFAINSVAENHERCCLPANLV